MDNNKIIKINYKTDRGNFNIEIKETKTTERQEYLDIKVKFSVIVKNLDNPDWKIDFVGGIIGTISKINDEKKLIEKLIGEIKFWIDKDEPGDICIGEFGLD